MMLEPSFAITAARDEGGGVFRLTLEPLAQADEGEGKWLCLRKEYLFPPAGEGGEPPFDGELANALFSDSGGAIIFPILLKNNEAVSLLQAARAFEAERAAAKYLLRAEHSRFLLECKLAKKGFAATDVAPALDFLEAQKMLDDKRFALAWLNTRAALHPEGKSALLAALLKKGVSREDAGAAIAAFFEGHDEEELCRLACAKLMRRGRTGKKLISSLCRSGFPASMALRVAGET